MRQPVMRAVGVLGAAAVLVVAFSQVGPRAVVADGVEVGADGTTGAAASPRDEVLARANALKAAGKVREAVSVLDEAVKASAEDDSVLLDALGTLLYDEEPAPFLNAAEMFFRAVAADPDNANAAYKLSLLLGKTRRFEEAREMAASALRTVVSVGQKNNRMSSCMLTVLMAAAMTMPPILGPPPSESKEDAEIEAKMWRQQLIANATAINGISVASDAAVLWEPKCHDGGLPHFYLSYHGGNLIEPARAINAMVLRVFPWLSFEAPHVAEMREGTSEKALSLAARPKTHVGFVSSRFGAYTPVAKSFAGIVSRLDPEQFDVTVVNMDDEAVSSALEESDAVTTIFNAYDATPRQVADALAGQELDVVVFLEHTMVQASHFIALGRHAPIQAVTWGHPTTSGLSTIDDFIGQDVENLAADARYSEPNLIRFETIGIYFDRPEPPVDGEGPTRHDFGIAAGANVYLCPQSLFKVHPRMDPLFRDILRGDPDGVLVFIDTPSMAHLTDHLLARFQTTLTPDVTARVVVLPTQRGDNPHLGRKGYNLLAGDFKYLLRMATVMLDTMPFGGGTTSLEALAQAIPIVTLPQRELRGRQTLKYYRLMGVYDMIAQDELEYVLLAVRVGTDKELREEIRGYIREGLHRLFNDQLAVHEWETYLTHAGQRARGTNTTDYYEFDAWEEADRRGLPSRRRGE